MGAGKTALWVMALDLVETEYDSLNPCKEWNETTNTKKLFSDLHICAMARKPTLTHHSYTYIEINIFNLKSSFKARYFRIIKISHYKHKGICQVVTLA